jgi:hypothetical protein
MIRRGKRKALGENSASVLFRPSGISQKVAGDRIRRSVVTSRRLTASVIVRQIGGFKRKEFLNFKVHDISYTQEKRHQ